MQTPYRHTPTATTTGRPSGGRPSYRIRSHRVSMAFAGLPDDAMKTLMGFLEPEQAEAVQEVREKKKARKRLPFVKFTSESGSECGGDIGDTGGEESAIWTGHPFDVCNVEDSQRLHFLTATDLASLSDTGYVVIDSFLQSRHASGDAGGTRFECNCEGVRRECEQWRDGGKLRPAGMLSKPDTASVGEDKGGKQRWMNASMRGDLMTWVHDIPNDSLESASGNGEERANTMHPRVTREKEPHLRTLLDRLRLIQAGLNAACPSFASEKTQTMITCYPGDNSRYVKHLDAHVDGPNRRLTLLYYANPDWQDGDGGAVRIFTPGNPDSPRQSDRAPFVDVSPRGDRLLVFQSRLLEHEVLPTKTNRFAVTTWLY